MISALALLADSDWNGHMGDWGAGWWIVMMVLMVAFWALVIAGVIWLVRSVGWGHGPHGPHGGESAIELLDRRLAHGEISPSEYKKRRDLLEGKPGRRTRAS